MSGLVDDRDLQELGFSEYWDRIYDGAEGHEWFKTFSQLKTFLEKELPSASLGPDILHLGCGDSTMPQDLLELGFTEQVSVDFSEVVIKQMESRCPKLRWRVEDVRDLKSTDSSFDITIDKGTMDAMIWGSNWDPPLEVRENIKQYMSEIARVLRPGGRWIYVTFRQPHFVRLNLTSEETWDIRVETLQDGEGTFEYFAYIMTKKSETS